jgi:uncharacterized integral membrane protein
MPTLIVYMIVGALIVLFASQNLQMVTVYLLVTPHQVPLIIVIGVSLVMGFITAILLVIRKAVKGDTKRTGSELMRR